MSAIPFRRTNADDDQSDPGTMGFLDHLDELRTRLIRSLIAVGCGMGVAVLFVDRIAEFILRPIAKAMGPGTELVATGLTEPLAFYLDLVLIGGLVLAAPVVTYQVWRFVAPGLYASEKRLVTPLLVMFTLDTAAAAAFSHYVLFPSSVSILSKTVPEQVVFLPTLASTFALYKSTLLAMLVVFQLPAIVFLMTRLRAMSAGFLIRHIRYALLLIVVAAAVLTSTGDALNLLMTALPMFAIYAISIVVAWVAKPRSDAPESTPGSSALGLLISASMFEQARRRRLTRSHR